MNPAFFIFKIRKEVIVIMMNIIVGAVLVIGLAIAIKEIRSKDKD